MVELALQSSVALYLHSLVTVFLPHLKVLVAMWEACILLGICVLAPFTFFALLSRKNV